MACPGQKYSIASCRLPMAKANSRKKMAAFNSSQKNVFMRFFQPYIRCGACAGQYLCAL
jgi:hypothetical protein